MRGHAPLSQTEFLGLYDRGSRDVCPPGYLLQAQNVEYRRGSVKTRAGFKESLAVAGVLRAYTYQRVGEVDRLLILTDDNKIYDSTDLVTPILGPIAGMTDFAMLALGGRAFISPHNGEVGLTNEFIYVYDGTTCRKAAGTAPAAAPAAETSATAGNVRKGRRLVRFAYESTSGYITSYSPYYMYEATVSTKKLKVTGMSAGPAGTVARWVIVSPALVNYDAETFDPGIIPMVFTPDGRLAGNDDAAEHTVNFYDSELVSLANYLNGLYEEIPAGVNLVRYRGRLVVCGVVTQSSIPLISESDYPESFRQVDGYNMVYPSDAGGGVLNAVESRGLLYYFKRLRTYVTQSNGQEPSTWSVVEVDSGQGTGAHGVSVVMDSAGKTLNRSLVATETGVFNFAGDYGEIELTFAIEDLWARINPLAFNKVQVVIDPTGKRVYVAVPLDAATEPSHILVGNYALGLNAQAIRWSVWTVPYKPTSLLVDTKLSTKVTRFKFASSEGNVYELDPARTNDDNVAIAQAVESGLVRLNDSGAMFHFAGVRLRITGSGTLDLTMRDTDLTLTAGLATQTLAATPGQYLTALADFTSEAASVLLEMAAANEYFELFRSTIFASRSWEERPL